MKRIKLTYILSILVIALFGCNQTKYVPDGEYLIKKNKFVPKLRKLKLDEDDVESILRQPENYKRLGIKWKLMAYNSIDSAKVANKRKRLDKEIREENQKRLEKQQEINQQRIEEAREKGKSTYTHKTVNLKDTVNPRKFFREWYKYKIGQPPVIFDSSSFNKTIEQLNAYLKQKGYYYGSAEGLVTYKENKKCVVTYSIDPGPQYIIRSTDIVCKNEEVKTAYQEYVATRHDPPLIGEPFDIEMLDSYRYRVAKFMRDSSFYGFSTNHITYVADTNKVNMSVDLEIVFSDRAVRANPASDSLISMKHKKYTIGQVFFHISDTLHYEGNFIEMMDSLGLSVYDGPFFNTADTLYYSRGRNDKEGESRDAVFYYNGETFVKPRVLEMQNFLEQGSAYSEKNAEASYNALLRMNLFKAVKTEMIENTDAQEVEVHYYLAPKKRQSYSFQPRATNNNGYLGVSASISYTNRNLMRGGQQLTFSVSGGFESQPAVLDQTLNGQTIESSGRSFNTFEIGPSLKLTLPGLFPLRTSQISKKRRPQTVVSAAYNYQNREDFERGSFQLNYQWKFIITKTSIFEVGLPAASVIKFVNIEKSPDFEQRLNDLGDLFLINAYSDQFVWQDWRIRYEYNIKEKANRKGNSQLYFSSIFDPAGNVLSAFQRFQDTTDNGQFAINGVGYSQFMRLDNQLIFSKPLGKERSINFKMDLGGGLPYGNTTTSLPYDYSFFAGGANDNRGWRARTLGPGGYKYYLDTLRTATQIGDVRIGGFAEFRFAINSFFKGAVFMDAGNIWTVSNDPNRPGGQLTSNWWRQIAVSTGFGLRMDLDYFIIRVDIGIPIRNPALPTNENWIFQKKDVFTQEAIDKFGANDYTKFVPLLYIPSLHFGIGYPF